MPITQGWMDGVEAELLAHEQEINSLTTELGLRLDEHSVRIDAAHQSAWDAQDDAHLALSQIYNLGFSNQAYVDQRIQQLRDELRIYADGIGNGLIGPIRDGVAGDIQADLAAVLAEANRAAADAANVAQALNFDLTDVRSVAQQILDVELPSQRAEIENLALQEIGTRGDLDLFLADFGFPTAVAGLDAIRSELEADIAPLRPSTLRLPASLWTQAPDSLVFSPKPPPDAAWFIDDDPDFGECLSLPTGRHAIGPSFHIPITQKAVFKLTLRVKVMAAPAAGATVSFGMTTWKTTLTPTEAATEVTVLEGATSGTIHTLTAYATADSVTALDLIEAVDVPILRLLTSSEASRAFPYFLQPAGGTRLRVDHFEIRDVTDTVQAMRYANTRMGEAMENITDVRRDFEEALAGFDPIGALEDYWTFAQGWTGWATSEDPAQDPAEINDIETGVIDDDTDYIDGHAAQFTGLAQLTLSRYIPILPDTSLDVNALVRVASGTAAAELVLTAYDMLNNRLGEFVVWSGNITTTTGWQTLAGQKAENWGTNAARARLSLRLLTPARVVTVDVLKVIDSTAQYIRSRTVIARNEAVQAKEDAEGILSDVVVSQGIAASARDEAGDYAEAASISAQAASASATDAGTAATAANSSLLSVEVERNIGNVLPDTFVGGLRGFTTQDNGSPSEEPKSANLVHGLADVDYGSYGKWTPSVVGHQVLTRGVQRTNGRVLRVTVDFKIISISGAATISTGAALIRLSGSYTSPAFTGLGTQALGVGRHQLSYVVSAEQLEGVTNVIPALDNQTYPYARVALRLNESRSCEIHIGRLAFEDITAETRAEDARAKATIAQNNAVQAYEDAESARSQAESEKNLAATARTITESARDTTLGYRNQANQHRADAVGARDTAIGARDAALGYRNQANEHRADAVVARNEAVSAQTGANNASAAATAASQMAVQVMSRGTGVLQSLACPWPAAEGGWSAYGTGPTVQTSTLYSMGNKFRWSLNNSTIGGVRVSSTDGLWNGVSRAKAYRVDILFTLISGSLNGAGVFFDWNLADGSQRVAQRLDAMVTGPVVAGALVQASGEFRVPAGVDLSAVTNNTCFIMTNFSYNGLGPLAAKVIEIHSIQFYPMTATEAAIHEQQTVTADLQGNAAAGFLVKAQAGNEVSLLELVAADGSNRQASVARLAADQIMLEGSVHTGLLTVSNGKNLLIDPAFDDGLAHYGFYTQHGATHAVHAAGTSWSHPSWPTLRIFQNNATATGYSDLMTRPIVTESGAQAPGVPVRGGQAYTASAYFSMHRAECQLYIQWLDHTGAAISGAPSSGRLEPIAGPANDPDNWPRVTASGIAPSGARYARLLFRKWGTLAGSNDSFLFVWKPQLEEVAFVGQEPSAWSPGGTTFINGGRLFAKSVEAHHLAVEELSAVSGQMGVLEVNNRLTISESGALLSFKTGPYDDGDGLFFGQTGHDGFAFSATRTSAAGTRQSVDLRDTGFSLLNARHTVSSTTYYPPGFIDVSGNQTITNTATTISLTIVGGGGCGRVGSSVMPSGEDTIVRLMDGSTIIHTWTAEGGFGAGQPGHTWGAKDYGQPSVFNTPGRRVAGYRGSGGGGGGTSSSRRGGEAGRVVHVQSFDVSGLTNPNLQIEIGKGGYASSGSHLNGGDGAVQWSFSVDADIPADVVPLRPTAWGSFVSAATGTFPDLGSGLWTLHTNTSTAGLGLGYVTASPGLEIRIHEVNSVSFVSSQTPTWRSAAARTVYYEFRAMGSWA